MRSVTVVWATLILAACSESPVGSNTPPSGSEPLGTGSIPAAGGSFTVNKPGDPLNGLTLALPSGAFGVALSVLITSSSNA